MAKDKQQIIELAKTLGCCPKKQHLIELDISRQDLLDAYSDKLTGLSEEAKLDAALRWLQFDAGYIGSKYSVADIRNKYEARYAEVFLEPFAERSNPNNTLTISQFQPMSQIMIRHFGSWNEALAALGYASAAKTMTAEQMIGMLREKAQELGRSPGQNDLGDYTYYIRNALGNGNWSAALRVAGLTPLRDFSEEELYELIRAKARELGRIPKAADVPENATIQRHMKRLGAEKAGAGDASAGTDRRDRGEGAWTAAVKRALAGEEFRHLFAAADAEKQSRPRGPKSKIPDEQLWGEIWELWERLGREPKHYEYAHAGVAMKKCDGKWREALQRAKEYGGQQNTASEPGNSD